jgi:hypothetical protein
LHYFLLKIPEYLNQTIMKTNIKILAILFTLFLSSLIFTKQASAQQPYVSFQVFYDQLSPYGQWVDYPNYGYVWIPDAGSDFAPYSTRGHWIMTEYGMTWVSDYNWGWAPFHYGRWDYDNYYGWFWVPDTEWGPAWVSWRRANGYYGWAPMGSGISISASFGRGYNNQNDHWTFVSDRYIDRSDINRYYVNRTDQDRIIRSSSVINNTYVDRGRNATYISGPARDDVQKVTGRRVTPVTIQENNKPGQDLSNGQLRIYRPQVIKNNNQAQRPAPSRIVNLKDVKSPSERNATNQPRNLNPTNNNRPVQQPNTVKPQNNNNNAQPAQQRKVNQTNNNRPVQQPNIIRPQNNNNNAQPAQQRKVNQTNNNRPVQQPNIVRPQNNNINNAQPAQQQKVNPANNNKSVQQPNTVKPSKSKKTELLKKSKSEADKKKTN